MKQGASKSALKERKDDLYETPACATRALLRTGVLDEVRAEWSLAKGSVALWEPCAGRGAIARELIADGWDVARQDLVAHPGADEGIITPVDFLMERSAPGQFRPCPAIVTNPPYKLADDFIRHGLTLVPHVIVLLRLMAIEGAGRADLMDRHCRTVYAGIERLPAMHREGWDGPKVSNSGAPFAWFHFTAARVTGATALRRISWRV